jgi:S-formylglutathione hydrolase FrmB
MMRWLFMLAACLVLAFHSCQAEVHAGTQLSLTRLNRKLAGQLIDYTDNHGVDRRIWSNLLQQRRDLYVYVPPHYDPTRRYPVLLWLHGVDEDEKDFVELGGLAAFDAAMAAGLLPPLIIAIPDGSYPGKPILFGPNPQWANSQIGPYRDYLLKEVWPWMLHNYPILPQRESHILGGFSAGGGASFRLAMLTRQDFGICMGIHPDLNIRWLDCHGNYLAPFDPHCWGWRTSVDDGKEVLGRFLCGLLKLRVRLLIYPLYGKGPEAVDLMSEANPIEIMIRENIRPGELAMWAGFGGKDGFNIKAQVDSFLYVAQERGLTIHTIYDPLGTHSWRTGRKFLPDMIAWLNHALEPIGQPGPGPCFKPVNSSSGGTMPVGAVLSSRPAVQGR